MRPTAAIMARLPQLEELASYHSAHQPPHARSNYHDPNREPFAGLAGYATTRHYYGGSADGQALSLNDYSGGGGGDGGVDGLVGDLAAAPYANYPPKAISGALGSKANGFVPTTATGELHNNYNRLQSEGKIDFVINTANYELDVNEETEQQQQQQQQQQHEQHPTDVYHPSYSYQPRAPPKQPLPLRDYRIEQFSNYLHAARLAGEEQERMSLQPRQVNDDSAQVFREQRPEFISPVKRQQRSQEPQHQQLYTPQAEDQQLLYSQSQSHIANLPASTLHNSLPPITTRVHHTPASSKAIAGLPLSKHIEITKHVPITHYQKQLVPFKQAIELRVPRPVITAIPKPIAIKIPVPRMVPVPQLQEVKIPIEKVKTYAVEQPIPFVVERRVPYRVEKAVAQPFYYPYPVKVPIVRTVVHKQQPQYGISPLGIGSYGGWNSGNHLLG
ncbi:uncharacterized protein LOC6567912 [Drosophila grimshawi]|uniref:GH18278 n=1 Tax=Drosophila grimshawi TaxID=7222 RepID=B4JSE0_DROGR|nr:uncharacterized protein LOC6567912 [Drosophila grimshawi]EDV94680.1 GH18278 [Drosophila grimshawi]